MAKPIKRNGLLLGPEMTHFSPEQVFKGRFINPFNNRFYNGNANAALAISVLADVTVSFLVERKSVLFHIRLTSESFNVVFFKILTLKWLLLTSSAKPFILKYCQISYIKNALLLY